MKVEEQKHDNGTQSMLFECPGCKMLHIVHVVAASGPVWAWNGDKARPTFTPSILVTCDHMSEAGRQRARDFYAQHGRYPTHDENPYDTHDVCHSFVTDGRIQFLGDCTHALKGQTIDLPEIAP